METKKLCIIVPYRDRAEHLKEFLPSIKTTLDAQKIEHTVLIVEQTFSRPFNRAKLLNVGFDFTKESYDYYCMHDVDMLPIHSDYSYCEFPTHLASQAEQFGWRLPYNEYFGGVTMFNRENFKKLNGYSNLYEGWGAEDDDVFRRCVKLNIQIQRRMCKYRSLAHDRIIENALYQKNIERLQNSESCWDGVSFTEGLSTLSYSVLKEENVFDALKITVEI